MEHCFEGEPGEAIADAECTCLSSEESVDGVEDVIHFGSQNVPSNASGAVERWST